MTTHPIRPLHRTSPGRLDFENLYGTDATGEVTRIQNRPGMSLMLDVMRTDSSQSECPIANAHIAPRPRSQPMNLASDTLGWQGEIHGGFGT